MRTLRTATPRLTDRRGRSELQAAAISDPGLQRGYQYARTLNAQHGKTYYLATLLLPRAKRPYVHALYGFARYADDIVDDLDPGLHPDERARRFRLWSEQFLRDVQTGQAEDPIVRVVLDTITRWQIPVSYFSDFLTSMAMDLTITEYASHDDLNVYIWGSAAVIGLQMLPILGYADEHPETELGARAHAIDLGIAFQLTNFLRDVSDDLVRGRIYLPQDSLRACGVDRDRLLHARATGAIDRPIRDLIALEVDRARRRYRTAEAGIDLVDRTSRDCLRTALTLYSDILTVIEDNDHNVFSSRATVGFGRRGRVAALGLAGAWASRRNLQGRRRQGLV